MELRHLRSFNTVAQTLHFGQAAQRLNLSQPAVSKQIRELEEELGFSLFIRYKKAVALTDAGKVFWQEAQIILQQVDQSLTRVKQAWQGEAGEVRLGYDSAMLEELLTPLLKELHHQWPGVKVRLQEGCNRSLSTALLNDELDIALTYGPIRNVDLSSRIIGKTRYMVVLPAHHPLAHQPVVSLGQLRQENFILCPRQENPELLDEQLRLFIQAGYQPAVIQETTSQAVRVNMVRAGIGVTLTTSLMLVGGHPGVVFKPLQEPSPELIMSAVWYRSRNKPVVRRLVHLLG